MKNYIESYKENKNINLLEFIESNKYHENFTEIYISRDVEFENMLGIKGPKHWHYLFDGYYNHTWPELREELEQLEPGRFLKRLGIIIRLYDLEPADKHFIIYTNEYEGKHTNKIFELYGFYHDMVLDCAYNEEIFTRKIK